MLSLNNVIKKPGPKVITLSGFYRTSENINMPERTLKEKYFV